VATFSSSWRDAFGRGAPSPAERPARQPSAEQLVATPADRRAQIDAAYRRAKREARAAGRSPPKRKSIERRFQRYAATEGKQRSKPSKDELTKMRRVYQRTQRKARSEANVIAVMRRINARGGALTLERPFIRVSPNTRRGDRRGRPRQRIVVQIPPGGLDGALAAEQRGDRQGADDAMTQLVIEANYFQGALDGTDTSVTQVAAAYLD
jgi:hypothetical protein